MKVGEKLLGRKVVRAYPPRGGIQLVRLEAVASFICSRCTQKKTARLAAVRGSTLLCNGCYGRVEASAVEAGQRPAATASPSAAVDTRPPSLRTEDLTQVVVEELDSGLPYSVVNTGLTVEWKFHVRAEHLLHGTCPVPAEMADRAAPQEPLDLKFLRGRHRIGILDQQKGIKLRTEGDLPLLTGLTWQPFVLPGTRVSVRWDTWRELRLAYTPLDKPVVFGGTVVRYAYDPKIMTRELAAFDARVDRVEELVLIALRELGYLDEKGRALLPREALLRNTSERAQSERPPVKKINSAIDRLLSRRILTWEEGGVNRAGMLHHPARRGDTPVPLLCYTPTLREAEREELRDDVGAAYSMSAHRVAGHLMRIGHLGKEASPEARAAYREDHKRAGLAGPHELPRGFTYVREHERGI
ncbi:hypothetical protein [Streptomyces sp. BSE7-9]|uniref:hypothetical protein n=1 Tax=Streptomyces sp. BSE7-9 TaxID=2759948 RepID=UPI000FE2580D|nr:hypothetical protein [Streptomyces sp. BSE7-9]MBJ6644301.1 hypothetical protein [Streptomyces sp. BSE7-9]